MAIAIGIATSFSRGGQSWEQYWASLVSAVVEGTASTKVIMTFSDANTSLLATDFTIAGKTITLLERDATNKILTLTLSTSVIVDESLTLTFGKTSETTSITNNLKILDTYPTTAAAYSVRLLSSTYSGSCLRVRRSSDDAEQDIGFVSNVLDTTTLLSFIGANTGYLVKWYDQSGNSKDISMSVAATQPIVVNAGTLVTQTVGTPAIQTDNSARYMSADIAAITNAAALCVFTAYSSTVAAAVDTQSANIWNVGNLSVGTVLCRLSSAGSVTGEYMCYFPHRTDNDGKRIASTLYRRTANEFVLDADLFTSSGTKLYQNGQEETLDKVIGTTVATDLTPAAANIDDTMIFGAAISAGSLTAFTALKYSEIIIYATNISANRLSIEANISEGNNIDYYAISPRLTDNQGYCTDGTYHYGVYSYPGVGHAVRKRNNDATWSVAAQNTDPLNGLTEQNHLGDCHYYDGKIYVTCMDYADPNADDQCILIFDASDLSRLQVVDISATAGVTSGICIIPVDNIIYIVDYNTATGLNYIQKYNLTTFAYLGNITLASAIYGMQGITYNDGYFYISSYTAEGTANLNKIYKVSKDGTTISTIASFYSDEIEGVDFASNELRVIIQDLQAVGTGSVFNVVIQ